MALFRVDDLQVACAVRDQMARCKGTVGILARGAMLVVYVYAMVFCGQIFRRRPRHGFGVQTISSGLPVCYPM